MEKKIVIFVSGNGSNMENIITYFQSMDHIKITRVYSNKKDCGGINKAQKRNVPTFVFDKTSFTDGSLLAQLKEDNPSLIVLAGFLLKMPASITNQFENKIINIHPSLLPKYGGKGMYGKYVHEAVISNKEKTSGITIHYVNEHYDEGNIIAQFTCELNENETTDSLTQKIHALEMTHFPKVIQQLLS